MIRMDNESKQIHSIFMELQKEFAEKDTLDIQIRPYRDCAEGYRIEKKGSECTIHFADKSSFCRGLLHALSMKENGNCESRCAFDALGYMCDCSRNAVPKPETIKHLIRVLALLGYHYLGLYTEDTFKAMEEPYFGYMRGAYTQDEIRELADYAEIFGMELRPYIQTLAHFNALMRYEAYSRHMDVNDILLAGDDRTYEFLDHLIHTIADTYHTKHINIGMDEAHMVGLGKYLDQHGYEDRFHIMEQHLAKVLEICRRYGLKAQMWSDMFFRLACGGEYYIEDETKLKKIDIPDDIELCYWDYYSTDRDRYEKMLRTHKLISPHIAFAGGAWKWTGFTPHNAYSIEASHAALDACVSEKISDVVITGWGDDGGEASIFSTLPSLAYDADKAYGTSIAEEAIREMTGMSFNEFMEMDIANPYPEVHDKHNNAGKYFLYNDPLIGTFDSAVNDETADYYRQAEDTLGRCLARHPAGPYTYVFETQEKLCRVLQQKADLGCRIRQEYRKASGKEGKEQISSGVMALGGISELEIPEIIENVALLYQTLQNQWHTENKAFGFEVQAARFGGLKQRLTDTEERLKAYLAGTLEQIDELEEEYLPFHYFDEDEPQGLEYNVWCDIVSPGRMY